MQHPATVVLIVSCIVGGIHGEKIPYEDWLAGKAAMLEKHPDVDVAWNAYPSANQLAESQSEAVSLLAALLFGGQDGGMRDTDKMQKRRFTNFGSRLEAVPDIPEVTHSIKPMKAMRYGKKK